MLRIHLVCSFPDCPGALNPTKILQAKVECDAEQKLETAHDRINWWIEDSSNKDAQLTAKTQKWNVVDFSSSAEGKLFQRTWQLESNTKATMQMFPHCFVCHEATAISSKMQTKKAQSEGEKDKWM